MPALDRLVDTRVLRDNPTFRRLWIGTSAQLLGRQVTTVAVLYQVWQMTHQTFWVGVTGLVTAAPTLVFSTVGGSLADRGDRRRIALVTSAAALVVALLLAAQATQVAQAALAMRSVPVLFVLVAAQAAATSTGGPSRRAVIPRIVPADQVGAAIALNHVVFQLALLAGPALAGLLIGAGGLTSCYALDALAFAAALYGVRGLPPLRPEPPDHTADPAVAAAGRGPHAIWSGLRFLAGSPVLAGSLLTDLAATVLSMPFALLPAINAERLGGQPQTLGLLFSAIAVGGVTAGALSAPIGRIGRAGLVQLVAAGAWGLALAGAGVATTWVVTVACLAVAGAADTTSVIVRGTTMQLATPDSYRGRASAAELMVGVAGPQLGNFRAGAVASAVGAGAALVSGGLLAAVAVAAVAATNPSLRGFRTPAAPAIGEPGIDGTAIGEPEIDNSSI